MKLHVLHDVVEDFQSFGTLSVLEASLPEHKRVDIRHAYRHTSRRGDKCMNETLRMAGCRRDWTQPDLRMLPLKRGREGRKYKVD